MWRTNGGEIAAFFLARATSLLFTQAGTRD
jgi:hypothetical protein